MLKARMWPTTDIWITNLKFAVGGSAPILAFTLRSVRRAISGAMGGSRGPKRLALFGGQLLRRWRYARLTNLPEPGRVLIQINDACKGGLLI